MLIDVRNYPAIEEGLHSTLLFAVIFDRRGVESRVISASIADLAGLTDIFERFMEKARRDPNHLLEIFFVGTRRTEFEAIESRFHAVLDNIGIGKGAIRCEKNVGGFQVFFEPSDSPNEPLGVDKTFPDVEGRYLDDAGVSHFYRDTLKKLPIDVCRGILSELEGAEGASIIAALSEFYFNGTRRRRLGR